MIPRDDESHVIVPEEFVSERPIASAGPPRSTEPVMPSYTALPPGVNDTPCPEGPDVQDAVTTHRTKPTGDHACPPAALRGTLTKNDRGSDQSLVLFTGKWEKAITRAAYSVAIDRTSFVRSEASLRHCVFQLISSSQTRRAEDESIRSSSW